MRLRVGALEHNAVVGSSEGDGDGMPDGRKLGDGVGSADGKL